MGKKGGWMGEWMGRRVYMQTYEMAKKGKKKVLVRGKKEKGLALLK